MLATDLGDERLDPAVIPGPPQAVEYVGEPRLVPGQQGRHRVGRRPLRDALREIQFEDQRRGPPLAQFGDLPGKHRIDHAASLGGHVRGAERRGSPIAT